MTLFLLATLAALATAFVLQPVFAASTGDGGEPGGPASRDALRLAERRDQLLLAIAELDFERDAGKVGAAEHEAARAALLVETASVTRALDALEPRQSGPSPAPPTRRETAGGGRAAKGSD